MTINIRPGKKQDPNKWKVQRWNQTLWSTMGKCGKGVPSGNKAYITARVFVRRSWPLASLKLAERKVVSLGPMELVRWFSGGGRGFSVGGWQVGGQYCCRMLLLAVGSLGSLRFFAFFLTSQTFVQICHCSIFQIFQLGL